jgi:antitoxin (DNA-binding transcriptional repressor) of toxin-antitoxin stability system
MKKLAINKATASLAQYARELNGGPLVITDEGRPVAALVPVGDMDMESLAVGSNPKFLEIMERSRRREKNEGGISIDQVRQRLGLKNGVLKKKMTPRKPNRR